MNTFYTHCNNNNNNNINNNAFYLFCVTQGHCTVNEGQTVTNQNKYTNHKNNSNKRNVNILIEI